MKPDPDVVLASRFAPTVDWQDDGDWQDVTRRARSRQTRRTVTVAVVAVLLGVSASVAFAGGIHDLFFGSSAPPIVKRSFVQQNAMRTAMERWAHEHLKAPYVPTEVDASKAHGVLAVNTSDGPLYLWAAPLIRGSGECWFVDFRSDQIDHQRARGGGSCTGPSPAGKIDWSYSWSRAHPTLKILEGRVLPNARTVLVSFPNHPQERLPVVDHFFLAAFPKATKAPSRVVALDAYGHTLATDSPKSQQKR